MQTKIDGASAAAWINQQSELKIFVRTMLTGPEVVIREGHRVVGTGETLEDAVAAAMGQPNPPDRTTLTPVSPNPPA